MKKIVIILFFILVVGGSYYSGTQQNHLIMVQYAQKILHSWPFPGQEPKKDAPNSESGAVPADSLPSSTPVQKSNVANAPNSGNNTPGATLVSSAPTPISLAPAGTYFLLQKISLTTDSGITGILPGTKVRLVKKTSTGMRVTDGQNEFNVAEFQVTNDINIASQVFKADRARQETLTELTAQQAAEYRKQHDAIKAGSPPTPQSAAVQQTSNVDPLDAGGYNKTRDNIHTETLPNGSTITYWLDIYGRRHRID